MKSLMDTLLSPWTNRVLFTAVRLRIFTILADQSMTVEDISSKTETETQHLKPFLDACASLDLLLHQNGQYRNSQFNQDHLVEGKPGYIGDFLQMVSVESKQWDDLYGLIAASDDDPSARHEGKADARKFSLAMNNIGMLGEAEALADAVDLGDCRKMVDAGGGSGLYSVYLCRKNPHLRSVVIDKRETLFVTREMIAGCEEEDRIELLEADIAIDPLGKNIDAVLLSDVVYEDSFAEKVLKNVRASLRDNGLLIIRGYYYDPENPKPRFSSLFRLNQIVFNPNGSILTLPSMKKKVADMGFTIIRVTPLTELSSLILARRWEPKGSGREWQTVKSVL
jgi:predicted nicotinamide N-methyase